MSSIEMGKAIAKKLSGSSAKGLLSFGNVVNAGFALSAYNDAKTEGRGTLGSAATAVSSMIMYDAVGAPMMIGVPLLKAAPKLALQGTEFLGKMSRQMSQSSVNTPFQNATFADSQQAYTMRQAGMKLAQASKYNLQQAILGNEASAMHM